MKIIDNVISYDIQTFSEKFPQKDSFYFLAPTLFKLSILNSEIM